MENTNNSQEEFYTAEELAKVLKVNIMTIYRYIKAGKINAHKIGKEFRIKKVDFNHFLNNNKYGVSHRRS
jgi:excisionase family DNA binding protein